MTQTGPDPLHLLAAVLYKVEGRGGSVIVGDMTLEWIARNVTVEVLRDGGAFRVQWSGPSVSGEGT